MSDDKIKKINISFTRITITNSLLVPEKYFIISFAISP